MPMIDRIKAICLKPNVEWPVIEAETTSTRDLMLGYVAPLAAITPIAGFVGGVFIGRTIPFLGTYHVPLTTGLTLAVVTYLLSIAGVYVLSLIISALAPSFAGQKNNAQALKVAVYAYTPAWVAGALTVFTSLSILAIIASFYGLYVLYLGLPVLMKNPKEKSSGYTIVIVICAIVLWVVIGAVGAAVGGAGMLARGGLAGLPHAGGASPTGAVQFDKDSFLGRMQAMGQAAQESSKKMEEAQKSGDPNAQAQAAIQGLGALLGGGKRVDPIGLDQLKPFVPATFAGLDKTGGSAEKNGMVGLAVSKAEGSYSDHAKKHVTLEITDTGGASGLVGLAGWMNMQGEREDDNGFEKTDKVDGRLTHEKGSKRPGGSNEFTVVLGDRFIVAARGTGVELPVLKTAVAGLDLGKLEALKSVGVQK
jgi:Yip1-like protein